MEAQSSDLDLVVDWTTRDGEPLKVEGNAVYVWVKDCEHWIDGRTFYCQDENGDSCKVCNSCPGCCKCLDCGGCRKKTENVCDNCDECPDCCHCATCDDCGAKVESICNRCDNCQDHCECVSCDNCGRLGDALEVCSNCNECIRRCCNCRSCELCGESSDRSCGDCDRCSGCCECHQGRLARISPRSDVWHGRAKDKVGPRRYVSAEIEVSTTSEDHVSEIVQRWKGAIVDDGSLGDQGSEINTAPARGMAWRAQIQEICKGLKMSKAEVDKACGLHVHVDARDYTYYDVRRLIRLYARLEPALFGLVSESRRSSTYAEPCARRYQMSLSPESTMHATKLGIFKSVYGMRPDKHFNAKYLKQEKYNSARYAALNLHSWVYRGTIEYRLHQGSTDATKIQMWGELWSHIVEYTYSHTDKEIGTLPGLPDYEKDLRHVQESYTILRDHVCKGMPELQAYLDDRAKHFGVIRIETQDQDANQEGTK